MVTMDRAYNFYKQFAEWTEEGVFFVTRQKKNAGMVHLDSPFAAQRNPSLIASEEGIFNRSSFDPHPFDKPFGCELGSNRRTASVRQADRE
jgi:hypothetical protein